MKFIKKACSRLNILCMMKLNLDRNSLEKLYFGFIRPILEYGSVVWDNCTREQSDLIESVRINILTWILTKLGTYIVLRRVWNPIDFQGQRSRGQIFTV
jgi:hypothetical protein